MYDKIQKVAKTKGLTMSRLLALVCKKAFTEKSPLVVFTPQLVPEEKPKDKVDIGELDFGE